MPFGHVAERNEVLTGPVPEKFPQRPLVA